MRSLVNSMGVEGISRGQVSRITSSINEFVDSFRNRPLKGVHFPVLFIDAIFEKVRIKGHATFTGHKRILTSTLRNIRKAEIRFKYGIHETLAFARVKRIVGIDVD